MKLTVDRATCLRDLGEVVKKVGWTLSALLSESGKEDDRIEGALEDAEAAKEALTRICTYLNGEVVVKATPTETAVTPVGETAGAPLARAASN